MLHVIERDNLVVRARELGAYLKGELIKLQERHEVIGDIRGQGLLLGVEFIVDRETRQPAHDFVQRLSKRCFELGFNVNRVGGPHSVWRIAPPLTVSKSEIDAAIGIIDTALKSTPVRTGSQFSGE